MFTNTGKKNLLRRAAIILLFIVSLDVILQYFSAIQTRYQLAGPLIPQSTVDEISNELLYRGLLLTVFGMAAFVFFFYKKYLWVSIIVILAIIASRVIHFTNLFSGN